ncbi:MAG: hypothetical protein MK193_05395 [Lentisphaeria bacterium]|nr:hypothetical protein [Lentisphaeria bacterium]
MKAELIRSMIFIGAFVAATSCYLYVPYVINTNYKSQLNKSGLSSQIAGEHLIYGNTSNSIKNIVFAGKQISNGLPESTNVELTDKDHALFSKYFETYIENKSTEVESLLRAEKYPEAKTLILELSATIGEISPQFVYDLKLKSSSASMVQSYYQEWVNASEQQDETMMLATYQIVKKEDFIQVLNNERIIVESILTGKWESYDPFNLNPEEQKLRAFKSVLLDTEMASLIKNYNLEVLDFKYNIDNDNYVLPEENKILLKYSPAFISALLEVTKAYKVQLKEFEQHQNSLQGIVVNLDNVALSN